MSNTPAGPYPILFARNVSAFIVNFVANYGRGKFRISIYPGEVAGIPWPVARSAGFQRIWKGGLVEVSGDADFEDLITELPEVGGGGTVLWSDIEELPLSFPPSNHLHTTEEISDSGATGRSVLKAADASTARSAIGAGTSNLALGTSAGTAKAGDYHPTWAQVTGKPATFAPADHTHTASQISDASTVGQNVLKAANAAAARTAIEAGTSSLTVGSVAGAALAAAGAAGSASTAARSDHTHPIPKAATQADSTAEDVAGLVADFNALLAKLRAAGLLAE